MTGGARQWSENARRALSKTSSDSHAPPHKHTHTGVHYPLPAGYRAYLLPPPSANDLAGAEASAGDGAPKAWPATATWPALVAWSLDALPGPADPARRALDWVGVAEAVASHVGAEAVMAALG